MPSDYKAITKYNEDQLGKDTESRKTQISMYSDSTHFVYEILQNADDYGANEVCFKLFRDGLEIEHNGEPFTEENVKAVTYFGKSTSRDDLVKTGRFGIGFKSVFAFTATPIVISDTEHFEIYGLYRVKEYPYPNDLSHSRTRIILPFNHECERPDYVENLMSRKEAHSKISERLKGLNMNILLFTQNIREIRWETENGSGHYSRKDDIDNNVRETTITDGDRKSKFLAFSSVPKWEGKEHKAVEITFSIDDTGKITQADERLYVLFPTIQETRLRFTLNGPYRTNPARETISEVDPFNKYLMKETCELIKKALPKIKERGLLTVQFLGVLPNDGDNLRPFFLPVLEQLVDVFKKEKLTPMKRGDHAVASGIYRYRGSRQLPDLVNDKDLAKILGKDSAQPLWVANAQRNQGDDKFLSLLQIDEWNEENLVRRLTDQPELMETWLKSKPEEWHQEFYALLGELSRRRSYHLNMLRNLEIVRLSDGTYSKGKDCYFPSDDDVHDDKFSQVAKGVYSSGTNKDQKENARQFLEGIGVSEVGEEDRINGILKQRYSKNSIFPKPQDLKRFIDFAEKEPDRAGLFKNYYIFELDDARWGIAGDHVFVDRPYLDTGLRAYYETLGNSSDRKWALSPKYGKYEIPPEKIGKFAKMVGAQTNLEAKEQKIPPDHPERSYLMNAPGHRKRGVVEHDYTIPEFEVLLTNPNLDKARLIWRTMDSLDDKYLEARYRKNATGGFRCAASSLVHALRKAAWIPEKNGEILRFVRPCDASSDHLPKVKGFSYEPWREWIIKIEFGKSKREREEQEQRQQEQTTRAYRETEKVAKHYGLDSVDQLEKLGKLNKENPEALQGVSSADREET